jgi:hypothetical protein
MLFSFTAIFSVLDLFLTSVALRIGLVESNYLLIAISNFLGLSIFGALGATKVFFVLGSGAVAFLGIRAQDSQTKSRALVLLSALALLLFAVSMNNLYWIITSP